MEARVFVEREPAGGRQGLGRAEGDRRLVVAPAGDLEAQDGVGEINLRPGGAEPGAAYWGGALGAERSQLR